MATDAEAIKAGFALPTGTDLIKNGDNAITQNAKATVDGLAAVKTKRPNIQPGADLNAFYGDDYIGHHPSLVASTTATLLNLPQDLIDDPRGFVLDVRTVGQGTIQQLDTYYWPAKRYIRNSAPSSGTGWTAWKSVLFEGDIQEQEQTPQARGYKTLPLILTAGRGGDEDKAPLTATVEYDVSLSSAINVGRYRFAIRDGNPRWGTFTAQAIKLTNVSIGGVQKLSAMTTNADGSISFSPWMSGNFGNLKFTYTAPQQPRYIVGGGRMNGTRRTEMPFELWLEVEVPSTTPAIGIVGDSNSVGVNTTIPVHDAWLSQYCRSIGAFPVLYGHSGDGMSQAQTAAHYKWNRWNHLDRPDLVIHANGANDIPSTEGGVTLAQMQEWARNEWAISDAKISKNKHGAVLKSRESGVNNTVRVQYNNWIKSLPDPLRDWHDIAAPVTANDTGGLLTKYISSDGIHMTTTGQTAIADSISRSILEPPQRFTVDQTVGRTIKIWDYINNREQMIYGDTGYRILPNDPAKTGEVGNIIVRRVGSMVELNISDKTVLVGGNVTLLTLPAGFRPWAWVNTNLTTIYDSVTPTSNGLRVTTPGDVTVYSVSAGEVLRGQVVFMTPDPWPTSLPGIANGATP